jgi:hypothetical protein
MDVKKKKELLYYYISSVSNLDMDELKIDVDFNIVKNKLDGYMVLTKINTYSDPDMDSINRKIIKVSNKIYEALTQAIYDENFKLVRQSQSKENFGKYVMGPVISNINYNWHVNETLIVEIEYMVESIDAENE